MELGKQLKQRVADGLKDMLPQIAQYSYPDQLKKRATLLCPRPTVLGTRTTGAAFNTFLGLKRKHRSVREGYDILVKYSTAVPTQHILGFGKCRPSASALDTMGTTSSLLTIGSIKRRRRQEKTG